MANDECRVTNDDKIKSRTMAHGVCPEKAEIEQALSSQPPPSGRA